jgi:hypothetical protein
MDADKLGLWVRDWLNSRLSHRHTSAFIRGQDSFLLDQVVAY